MKFELSQSFLSRLPVQDDPGTSFDSHSFRLQILGVIKERLARRFRSEGIPGPIAHEAIAAAEGLAWLSGYPQLFLPELAGEILRQLLKSGAASHPVYAKAA